MTEYSAFTENYISVPGLGQDTSIKQTERHPKLQTNTSFMLDLPLGLGCVSPQRLDQYVLGGGT